MVNYIQIYSGKSTEIFCKPEFEEELVTAGFNNVRVYVDCIICTDSLKIIIYMPDGLILEYMNCQVVKVTGAKMLY